MPTADLLVVDDDPRITSLLRRALRAEGYDVRTASHGSEGLARARERAPDLVVLDLLMPGMDGIEVCRRMRRTDWGRDALLIALTGWGKEEDQRRSNEAGFDAHLVKPVQAQTLQELLGAVEGVS